MMILHLANVLLGKLYPMVATVTMHVYMHVSDRIALSPDVL